MRTAILLLCICALAGADDPVENGNFEKGFKKEGVAEGWEAFGEGITFKANPRLGRIGGGIYGTEFVDSGHGDVNCDYQTMRMHGKVHLIDAARYDVTSKLQKQLGPEVMIVGKLGAEPFYGGAQEALVGNPYENGKKFAAHCFAKSKETGHWAHAYYALNEGNVNDARDMAKIARFEKGFVEQLHKDGLRGVVINNSVGTPADIKNMLLPEVRELFEVADYAGYHCYGGPGTELMCHPKNIEHFSLRYRRVKKMYDERGWRLPPVIYTEGTTFGGWHDSIKPEAIRDDLVGFSRLMAEDEWVTGLAVFCTGNWKGQIWKKWNIVNYPGWKKGQPSMIVDAIRKHNMDNPVDAHTGVHSQELLMGGGAADGGIRQTFRTRSGGKYALTCWFRHEFTRGWPQKTEIQVAVVPGDRGDDPKKVKFGEDLIRKGGWESDRWYRHEEEFRARGSSTTVWFRAVKPEGLHARVYIDDVSVSKR